MGISGSKFLLVVDMSGPISLLGWICLVQDPFWGWCVYPGFGMSSMGCPGGWVCPEEGVAMFRERGRYV